MLLNNQIGIERGFSLLESMVATLIVGLAFAGIFNLTAVGLTTMQNSISKQKLELQAAQIMEVIDADLDNIEDYDLDLTSCSAPGAGDVDIVDVRRYEWCRRLNNELGMPGAGDTRSVSVDALADGKRAVTINFANAAGTWQIISRKIYEE